MMVIETFTDPAKWSSGQDGVWMEHTEDQFLLDLFLFFTRSKSFRLKASWPAPHLGSRGSITICRAPVEWSQFVRWCCSCCCCTWILAYTVCGGVEQVCLPWLSSLTVWPDCPVRLTVTQVEHLSLSRVSRQVGMPCAKSIKLLNRLCKECI